MQDELGPFQGISKLTDSGKVQAVIEGYREAAGTVSTSHGELSTGNSVKFSIQNSGKKADPE